MVATIFPDTINKTLLQHDFKDLSVTHRKAPLQGRRLHTALALSGVVLLFTLLFGPSPDAAATRDTASAAQQSVQTGPPSGPETAKTRNGAAAPAGDVDAAPAEPLQETAAVTALPEQADAAATDGPLRTASLEPPKEEAAAGPAPLPSTPNAPPAPREEARRAAPGLPETPTETVTVRSGDTLSSIFGRVGLTPQQLHAVVHAEGPGDRLQDLRPGEKLAFWLDDGAIRALDYRLDRTRTLQVRNTDDGFEAQFEEREVEVRRTHASGIIDSSLFAAGRQAGLPDKTIMELAYIFGWDVDFALDIRAGDRFTVMYEEHYLDGEKLRNGAILAAEFVNRGRVVRAVRYTDPKGRTDYYDPDGRSMRKAFLRSPVDFRRISSRFQRERYHPVLGKKRPHRGVDYAANVGTPIKASGDGKIIFRGWKGGYGRAVIIRHGGRYTTLYGHMSRFRGGLGTGSRVKQGQVIGYVGASGLATGPHLHYEFRVNGVHRDPLKVELPKADPIREAYRQDFLANSRPLLAELESLRETQVAYEAGAD